MNNKISEGIFLKIPRGREVEFWGIIQDAGFEPNANGVVNYILSGESEFETEEPHIVDVFKTWKENNPEQWELIQKKGSLAIGNLKSWLSKKII